MSGYLPQNPAWCSYCKTAPDNSPCESHGGPNGEKVFYHGYEAYEPSNWVKEVVGSFYRAWDGFNYICTGYDPRNGFWVKNLSSGEERNISERAIGRTYHAIHQYDYIDRNQYAECVLAWF